MIDIRPVYIYDIWMYGKGAPQTCNFITFLGALDIFNFEIKWPVKPDDDQIRVTIKTTRK